MTRFRCGQCKTEFDEAVYWFDSLHFERFDKREIIPFCGPICTDGWSKANGAQDWAIRQPPYPRGKEWLPIYSIHPSMCQN